MHKLWGLATRVENGNKSYWFVNIAGPNGCFILSLSAGGSWTRCYPKTCFVHQNIRDYSLFEVSIYMGTHPGDHEQAERLGEQGKICAYTVGDFNALGIEKYASMWSDRKMIGDFVLTSIVESIYDDLEYLAGGDKMLELDLKPEPKKPTRCRACGEFDEWNEPDFIVEDGCYTCYRCRNHIVMKNRGIPENARKLFAFHYESIDVYTKH